MGSQAIVLPVKIQSKVYCLLHSSETPVTALIFQLIIREQ